MRIQNSLISFNSNNYPIDIYKAEVRDKLRDMIRRHKRGEIISREELLSFGDERLADLFAEALNWI